MVRAYSHSDLVALKDIPAKLVASGDKNSRWWLQSIVKTGLCHGALKRCQVEILVCWTGNS